MKIQVKPIYMIFRVVFVALLLTPVSIFLPRNNYVHGQTPTLSITEPQNRSEVCWRERIRGTISDINLQVYVLIHPMTTNTFLVQPLPEERESSWEAYCNFGKPEKGIGEHFEIIVVASKNKKLFKEGETLSYPLLNNPNILHKSKPVMVTRAACLNPSEKAVTQPQVAVTKEVPKEPTSKPGAESTTVSPPVEEYSVLSGVMKLLIILLVIGVVGVIGWLLYRIYHKLDGRIRMVENNMERMIEDRRRQFADKSQGGMREGEFYPSQEVSKIFGRMENIERELNTQRDKYREMVGEWRVLQGIFLRLKDSFQKEMDISKERVSLYEGILKEINKVREKGIFYNEKTEGRKLEEQIPQVTKIPLTEEYLVEWWNEFGNQRLSTCRETLAERFSDVKSEVILEGRYPDEWKVIGISKTSDNLYYVVPFKGGRWWTDYPKGISDHKKWFELEEEKEDMTLTIGSIKSSLPKARKILSGSWELVGPRGKVSIKESQ